MEWNTFERNLEWLILCLYGVKLTLVNFFRVKYTFECFESRVVVFLNKKKLREKVDAVGNDLK